MVNQGPVSSVRRSFGVKPVAKKEEWVIEELDGLINQLAKREQLAKLEAK
jgi:hypothetical protein